jgi:non-ribosomal peptide synthetase component F
MMNENTLQYIDYSVHERVMNMTSPREFWRSELEGYNFEQPLSLPRDRQRVSASEHSGLAYIAQINFDDEISASFLNYASSHSITLFQLGLATFYAFLFKLSYGQHDLCIASVNANRYRSELQDLIGMFVATLPYRQELNSHWSFNELVKQVREKCLSILKHSHYSLQQILADFRLNQSNVPFLEIMFDFFTVLSNVNYFSLNDANLEQVSIDELYEVAKFDFFVSFVYNPTADTDKLSCLFVCSRDLFEKTTVTRMARRFQQLVEQVFRTTSNDIQMDGSMTPIHKFSLILPKESDEIKSVTFHRLENIINEGM